uniref:Uncharacterized protein n=1 Tax=Heterorhabditis bacteriophora TaxID=37862 RepID=A0A1I7WM32_HETBA
MLCTLCRQQATSIDESKATGHRLRCRRPPPTLDKQQTLEQYLKNNGFPKSLLSYTYYIAFSNNNNSNEVLYT